MEHYMTRINQIMAMQSEYAQELAIERLAYNLDRDFLNRNISKNEYDIIYRELNKI